MGHNNQLWLEKQLLNSALDYFSELLCKRCKRHIIDEYVFIPLGEKARYLRLFMRFQIYMS